MRKIASGPAALLAGAVLMAGAAHAQPALSQSPWIHGLPGQDPGPAAPVSYEVSFDNLQHHEAKVVATWRGAPAGPLTVRMSRSSPGRYAIHEFAKNVYSVSAVDGAGRPLAIQRTDPYSWTVLGHDGVVRLTYTLFGDRGDGTYAQIDATHAHLNMPATFMWAQGYDAAPIRVRFRKAQASWSIATQLPPAAGEADTFWAPNLQYFMDSPTELSDLTWRQWQVADHGRTMTFRLALHHTGTAEDADKLADKLKRLVPQHIAFFGEAPRFDYGTYTFIADYMPQISGDGMEHRNSTIITNPASLQRADFAQLSTASHEFTHAWNVERMRPAELEPFDFTRANPTPSLWLAEGFTNYIGPLMIRRSGQSSVDQYLADLGRTLSGVVNAPGRQYGGPQEMSLRAPFLDAATSIDPTNPNTTVSYYPYGQIVALALDLQLRGRGASLEAFMRRMWRAHGLTEVPYRPDDIKRELAGLTDPAFADGFFRASVEGNALPDFAPLLAQAGLALRAKSPDRAWLGASRLRADGSQMMLDEAPSPGSPLYAAGVERGDRLVGVGRFEFASDADWQDALGRLKPGERTTVRYVQRGVAREAPLTVGADPTLEVVRFEAAGRTPTKAQLAFRSRWLEPAAP